MPGQPRGPEQRIDEVILVDPSLFTAPYDARLSDGLVAAGVDPLWVTRGLRPGEEDDLRSRRVERLFYRHSDGARRAAGQRWRWLKGVDHLIDLGRLVRLVRRRRPLAVHVQWGLIPRADRLAMARIRHTCPVVMTVHDVEPFNGKAVAAAQRDGFADMLRVADRLIVHTAGGRDTLIRAGLDGDRIAIVPHGLLEAPAPAPARTDRPAGPGSWTLVQFGKIQGYKGVDLLVEALELVSAAERARLRVVIAGEPLIDMAPIRARADQLGLGEVIDWRLGYLDGSEIAALMDEADAFVFPYRAIEASGAFLLVAGLGKWIVASDLGAFSELMGRDERSGALVPAGDVAALAKAIVGSIDRRPTRALSDAIPDWATIGRMTRDVYRQAAEHWALDRGIAG